MTTRYAMVMVLAAASAGSCASDRHVASTSTPTPAISAPEAVIVRLVGRRQTVTVLAGAGGPRYSVTDPAGRTVVSRATLQELRSLHPEAYQLVQPDVTAYAGL